MSARLFLAPLDREDGECSIPYFSLAKLKITNATQHSFPSAILQSLRQLLGRQILKPITLYSLVWESAEVQSTQLAEVTVEDTDGKEIALCHPNGSLALGGRLRRSKQTGTSSRSDHSHRNALGHSTQENLSDPEFISL